MSAVLEWDLKGLAAELARLTPEARARVKPVLVDGAERIRSRYLASVSGDGVESVGRGTKVVVLPDPSDLSARVANPSPLGHLHEFGTVDRYTATGAYRGRMPARPRFVPIAEEERARTAQALAGALDGLQGDRYLRAG
jgi:hypothetical protein